ncbi:aldo/keto reductase [Microbacterium trichothecenolyticum]|uniref:Pyridoxal 4-dehydrogenase n=1 Tax=Microbacterium trichothecenolyticum TaxID=69370 RepID=A0A0M2HHM6_MICTR|nr:aldo/keto reductase [Microbacterium trichothecenolyticum]KJL43810.1 Pyridoxal 4-dehydrogenase [Microbacterium trichothecenolyticum]
MERRTLGGLEVSILGLGTSRLASIGTGRSKSDAKALFDACRECGVNVIDTADAYGSTMAERWIGELTRADRERWVVVTKIGLPTVDLPGPFRVFGQRARKTTQARAGSAFALDHASLTRSIERSLKRLRRDRIEIFLLHLPPASIVEDDEAHEILQEAQRSGVIAHFGVSTDMPRTIAAVRDAWGCPVAETAVNPWSLASAAPASMTGVDLIANRVMGSEALRVQLLDREAASSAPHRAAPIARRLLRHAAAVPGVKVILTGTMEPAHLRDNARAIDTPVTAEDLIA